MKQRARAMPDPTHIAIVLAAGGSLRLGRPKQMLTRNSETLVHRAVRLAIETGARDTLVITGSGAEAIEAAVEDLDCTCVRNLSWSAGLASSLVVAAAALEARVPRDRADVLLILGCDQPALECVHLRALLDGAATRGHAATLHDARAGIPAVVPVAMLVDALHADALSGDVGLGPLLRRIPAQALHTLDAPELMFDLDTREDVSRAVACGLVDADGRR